MAPDERSGFTTEDANAVRRAWVAIAVAEGNPVKGHKIALTGRATRWSVGIDAPGRPDQGVLFI